MNTTSNFYEDMVSFPDFKDANDNIHYQQAPAGTWIVLSDVKGSTRAIEAGRYRDVNTIGAATIVAIQNAMPEKAFPYVFGGDGATALIPDENKADVERELDALRRIAQQQFDLELRVGIVPISELRAEGATVEIAKYALNANLYLAMFRGGGLTLAETKIKESESRYGIPPGNSQDTDLTKLSCRWQSLQAQNGQVLSLLVAAVGKDQQSSYSAVLEQLSVIFHGNMEAGNPVNVEAMRYRPLLAMLKNDLRHQKRWLRLLVRMIQTVVASVLFGLRAFRFFAVTRNYVEQTSSHSDHLKFDDKIRLTLDCTPQQVTDVLALCRGLHEQGKICYGTHLSEGALMTCFVNSFENGQHIHFIDGGDGGYATASKMLKKQLRDRERASTHG